jgi:hypothetical protein
MRRIVMVLVILGILAGTVVTASAADERPWRSVQLMADERPW